MAAQTPSLDVGVDAILRWAEHPSDFVREVFGAEPEAWQEEVLEAFPHHNRIAMVAPLGLENIIETPEGRRRWGDIVAGDLVFAEDGTPTPVLRRFDVGKVPLYRVIFDDGTSVTATANHSWKVQTPYDRKLGGRYRVMTTEEIMARPLKLPSGQRNFNIPIQGPADYPPAALPLDPYIFGLWLGDGVRNESSLVCPDQEIRDQLTSMGVAYRPRRRNDNKNITLYGMRMSWGKTGVFALYSHGKYIPDPYKRSSVEQRLMLLRGLMDSDGTVAKNGQTYLASSSLKLIDDFVWLARSLGYASWRGGPYKPGANPKYNGKWPGYRATISGPVCPFLANTSKKRRWTEPPIYKYTRYIDAIEPAYDDEAMCIQVAHPSSCFLANDFLVTHNCVGPGKTAVEAWLIWNFLVTRPFAKVGATSVTEDNINNNLWPELAKWQAKSPLLMQQFVWTKTRVTCRASPENWFCALRTWPKSANTEQQAATLAGFHADYVMFVLDESGDIPDAVMVSAERVLSSGKECHIVQAGNPSKLSGPLYRAATSERHLWKVVHITNDPDDPKRSTRASIEYAREMIAKARDGRDDPWVMVNVLGQFPKSSIDTLLSLDELNAAEARRWKERDIEQAPRVMGVDVAREGLDKSVLFQRQGLMALPPSEWRNLDSVQGAGVVSRKWQDWSATACFIDNTGGWGSGWIDNLRLLGRGPIGINFSSSAADERYYNKRAEMYIRLRDWIRDGGQVPHVPELVLALTQITHSYRNDRLVMEDKAQLKLRLHFSPDHADALALTFAQPVQSAALPRRARGSFTSDYDPYALTQNEMIRG